MAARFLVLLALLPCIDLAHGADSNTPLFEIRQVFEHPSAGTVELPLTRKGITEKVNVSLKPVLTIEAIKAAAATTNPISGDSEIDLAFTEKGTRAFAELTRKNTGRELAILVDGKLQCAPRINQEIPSGRAVISGNFTPAEAEALATKINASAKNSPGR